MFFLNTFILFSILFYTSRTNLSKIKKFQYPKCNCFFILTFNKKNKLKYLNVLINSPAQIYLSEIEDKKDRSGKFCIIEINGKIKWIEEGRYYDFFRIKQEENKKINLNRIIFYQNEKGNTFFGTPFLENIRINATILKHFRDKKIYRLKFKRKKNYKRFYGHRQEMSRILINRIEYNNELIGEEKRKFSFFKDDPIYYLLNRIHILIKPSYELKYLKKNFIEYLKLHCCLKYETFFRSKGNYKCQKMFKNILKTKKLSKKPEIIEEVKKIEEEIKKKRLKKIDPLEDFDPIVNEHMINYNFSNT